MIRPLQSGDALLADVRAADPSRLHLWWLGQSGFLVAWRGSYLLFDPYLSDSLTRKYADTDKPHERMGGLSIVAREAHRALVVERAGVEPVGIDDGETVAVAGFAITAAPAAHEEIERGRSPTSTSRCSRSTGASRSGG